MFKRRIYHYIKILRLFAVSIFRLSLTNVFPLVYFLEQLLAKHFAWNQISSRNISQVSNFTFALLLWLRVSVFKYTKQISHWCTATGLIEWFLLKNIPPLCLTFFILCQSLKRLSLFWLNWLIIVAWENLNSLIPIFNRKIRIIRLRTQLLDWLNDFIDHFKLKWK